MLYDVKVSMDYHLDGISLEVTTMVLTKIMIIAIMIIMKLMIIRTMIMIMIVITTILIMIITILMMIILVLKPHGDNIFKYTITHLTITPHYANTSYDMIPTTVRTMKSSGYPCLLDKISITYFKRYPYIRSLFPKTIHIVWETGHVPVEWKKLVQF